MSGRRRGSRKPQVRRAGLLSRFSPSLRLGRRPLVLVRPVFGLGNRLLAITSCLAIARLEGLPFAMLWEPGKGFSAAGWNELFDNDFALIRRDQYEAEIAGGKPTMSQWFERVPGRGARLRPGFDPRKWLRSVRKKGFVYDVGFQDLVAVLRHSGVSLRHRYQSEQRRCCRQLRAAPAIAREVELFAEAHFQGRGAVGFHIRRGDTVTGPYSHVYRNSPEAAFVEKMKKVVREAPDARIFLATDCEVTEARMKALFPDRLVTYRKPFVPSVYGDAKEGQCEALVEMLLLSRTRRVVGTDGSTFGHVASQIGGVPFEPALLEGWR
ncbi:hypothetical protein N9166_00895 [bacterium]|nr:hypothetical protein [bacterium]